MDLATLQSKMIEWLDTDTARLPSATSKEIINMSIREIIRDNDLRFAEQEATLTTVAAQQAYLISSLTGLAAGSVISRPLDMYYIHPTTSAVSMVPETSRDLFIQKYVGPTVANALPSEFCVWGPNVYLGPTPDRVLSVKVNCYVLPPDLSIGTDHNDLTDFGWEAVFYLALVKASKYGLEDERAELWQAEYRNALGALQREHQRMRAAARRPIANEPG